MLYLLHTVPPVLFCVWLYVDPYAWPSLAVFSSLPRGNARQVTKMYPKSVLTQLAIWTLAASSVALAIFSRSIPSIVFVLATWLVTYRIHSSILWAGYLRHCKTVAKQLLPIANSLRKNWPSHSTDIAGIGQFRFDPTSPFMLRASSRSSRSTIIRESGIIRNHRDGVIRFELKPQTYGNTMLEFCTLNSAPSSFIDEHENLKLYYAVSDYYELSTGTYLSLYSNNGPEAVPLNQRGETDLGKAIAVVAQFVKEQSNSTANNKVMNASRI